MENRYELNKELAQMLKGGVIMDVTTPEQAKDCGSSRCLCCHGSGTDNLQISVQPAAFPV